MCEKHCSVFLFLLSEGEKSLKLRLKAVYLDKVFSHDPLESNNKDFDLLWGQR